MDLFKEFANCLKPVNLTDCDGYRMSDCCNAPIINSDICSRCKEHCSCQCIDCDEKCDNDKI